MTAAQHSKHGIKGPLLTASKGPKVNSYKLLYCFNQNSGATRILLGSLRFCFRNRRVNLGYVRRDSADPRSTGKSHANCRTDRKCCCRYILGTFSIHILQVCILTAHPHYKSACFSPSFGKISIWWQNPQQATKRYTQLPPPTPTVWLKASCTDGFLLSARYDAIKTWET